MDFYEIWTTGRVRTTEKSTLNFGMLEITVSAPAARRRLYVTAVYALYGVPSSSVSH